MVRPTLLSGNNQQRGRNGLMKKLLTTSFAVLLSTATITTTIASDTYSELPTITKTLKVGDHSTVLSINPEFQITGGEGYLQLGLKTVIDASDLQNELPKKLNGHKKYDECGTRFSLSGASITPTTDGKALIGISAQAQQWECVKTKVPEVYMKRVKVAGVKFDVPAVRMVMKTLKTKLISQSARVEAVVWPTITGDAVTANVKVTKAAPSGLLGKLVSGLGLKSEIKKLAQKQVNKALKEKGHVGLPDEFKQYNVKIHQVGFVDLGGKRLGINFHAEGKASQTQIAQLIADNISK